MNPVNEKGSDAAPSVTPSIFNFGVNVTTGETVFRMPVAATSALGETPTNEGTSSVVPSTTGETDPNPEAEDPNLQFTPIIVLPEIHISSLEEDEDPLISIRAKLYRFATDPADDPPAQWKERGVGEVKILKHNETGAVRILMRRDKTLKICANHYVTTDMNLKPHGGSDKAFVWSTAADFSDGNDEPTTELLAIKFGNVENANKFRKAFIDAQKLVAERAETSFRSGATAGSEEDDDNGDDSEEESESDKENGQVSDTEKKETSGDATTANDVADKLASVNIEDGPAADEKTAL